MRRNDRVERTIVYRADFDKHVIISNFARRGWQRSHGGEDDDDWNVFWASVHSVRQIFNAEFGKRLSDHQIINHFPNHYELTRKDLMVKNIKRYQKECEKLELKAGGDGHAFLCEVPMPAEWVPTTFALPNDYPLFVEEFRRNPNYSWIAKPTGKAQGRGIFLVSKLQQLKKWSNNQKAPMGQPLAFREPYIISRYINEPFLVGGKKFDMRLYVLVPSYRPLKVYLFKSGFCRFCVEQYSTDVAEFENVFIHLTNVAIQKNAEDYNERHGGKWGVKDLMLFIEGTMGKAAADKLQVDVEAVLIHSLKAVQGVMINDRHCFEMYGFDILLDQTLKPWLLEVNASPSLSTTTEDDRLLKLRLINDVLNAVVPPNLADMSYTSRPTAAWCEDDIVGDLVCIYDEAKEKQRGVEDQTRRQNFGGVSTNEKRGFGTNLVVGGARSHGGSWK
eukprot:TRINITY_DN69033_c0_g1_i1.p1 TRINITY_DN69033_c0_g1~~TRINITY_DN69033_c0_g1_i1.p1  ORF type:complete len:446 (+),score=59.92 TRINITY_DN69033_c0_g1_i1:227-1564(+)